MLLLAAASLLIWIVSVVAMLRTARAHNRMRPVELRDERLASIGISDLLRGEARVPRLAMAGVVAASFVFAAAEFSLLFSLLFWGAGAAYFAVRDVRAAWAVRLEEIEELGPPTRRTYASVGTYGVLDLVSTGSWLTALVCVGAAAAHLSVV